jgi:hypothetical protein
MIKGVYVNRRGSLSSFLFTADPLFAERKTENVTKEVVSALE